MADGKQDSEIELVSGKYLDLLDPNPEYLSVGVIGWHLSQQNRFAGACSRPYSVAEHALLVARRLHSMGEAPETVLAGLHHDDTEAFLGDVTRPLKAQLLDYKIIERGMEEVIWEALDLPYMEPEVSVIIKVADNWALAAEAHYLMPSKGIGWSQTEGMFEPSNHDEYQLTEWLRAGSYPNAPAMAMNWVHYHERFAEEIMG